MCDENMEVSGDICARRKLEFRALPFKTKSFYVDVKSKSVRQRVEGYITSLGGSLETFLSNDIHVFVSDTRPLAKRTGRTRSHSTKTADAGELGMQNKQNLPLSRGRALLMKSRNNSQESIVSEVNAASNIQDKATEMGIQIETVHNFLKRCKELGASCKQAKKKDILCDITPIKWEDKCFIKVEDASCHFKPLHKKLDNMPYLYPENGGGSPFDGPVVLTKPATESTAKKERKPSRFSINKGGYCEMCQCCFKDTLKLHSKSAEHMKFVRNKENFSELDKLIRKLPSLNKFLFKYIPTKNVEKLPCYMSDTTPGTSPNVSINDKNIFNFEVTEWPGQDHTPKHSVTSDAATHAAKSYKSSTFNDKEHFSSSVFLTNDANVVNGILGNNNADVSMFSDISDVDSQTNVLKNLIDSLSLQNGSAPSQVVESPMTIHTPKTPCIQAPAPTILREDVPMSIDTPVKSEEINSCRPDVPSENQAGDTSATEIYEWNEETRQYTSKHSVDQVVPCAQSSEAVVSYSETSVKGFCETDQTVTSAIVSVASGNLTPVKSDGLSLSEDSINIHTESTDESLKASEICESSREVVSSSVGCPLSSSRTLKDTEVNLSPAPGHPEATSRVSTPNQLKLKFSLNPDPSPTSKRCKLPHKKSDKGNCVYYSHKTSDTKLKLCKVMVTPVTQKSNLMMFWKVRKTGECRLLFSSEKRKRSASDPDDTQDDPKVTMVTPSRKKETSPRPKRQRLVF